MIARMVLVGLVAALGISVQAWTEIRLCLEAVHSWTATQLAAWDAPARNETWPIVVAPPPELRRPVREPIIPDESTSGVAYELNRAAEGLDIPAQAVMVRRRPHAPEGKQPIVRSRVEPSAMPDFDTVEMRLMAALLRATDGSDGGSPPSESLPRARRSRPAIPPAVCTFSAGSASARAPSRSIAGPIPAEPPPGGIPRGPDRIEPVLDAGNVIALEWNRFGEGVEVSVRTPIASAPSKPAFAPIAPEVDPATSLADELNRASDGVPSHPRVPAPAERPTPRGPSSDVAHAMRLTREAVHAWMNVMTSRSVLRLSAR